ncbi:MAG TPA: hypothetical protein ENJ08_12860 [Gammaproteobacteria bacterium]|nr:hypothetical protein [Gammaproteobacteria bacterium]
MNIHFPDDIADKLGMNEKEMLELLSVSLYKKMGIHGAMCGRILNTSEMAFHGVLEKYGEFINYGVDDLRDDMESLKDI